MNTDDTIRAILRAEAGEVHPSAAGWDAITAGIAARDRRRWWLRGSALVTAAAVVAVAAYAVTTDPSPHSIDQAPVSQGPSVSDTPSPAVSPSAVAVPAGAPIGAIWPLTTAAEMRAWQADRSTYPALSSVGDSALGFAHGYLGIADATVASIDARDMSFFFEVRRGDVVVTTLELRGFGDRADAPYLVVAARSDALVIDRPAPGDSATSPLPAHGRFHDVDPAITVRVRADGSGSAPVELASERAVTGPPDVWDARLSFTTSAGTGSILATTGSLKDSGISAAAALPVTFAKASAAPMPSTFVAVRDQRVAVVSTATGAVVRYLTEWVSGGGSGAPELSADGKTVLFSQGGGTCSTYIQSVPYAGGKPTTLVPSRSDTVVIAPSRRGDVFAYTRVRCQPGKPYTEDVIDIVVTGPAGTTTLPVDGDVASGPVVGEDGRVAYVVVKDRTKTLWVDRTAFEAPAGWAWKAVTWDNLGRVVGAATNGSRTRIFAMDTGTREPMVLGDAGRLDVTSLDYDESYRHLLLGVRKMAGESSAYTYEGGVARLVPGSAGGASWS
jgi:hypothetical protein